MEIDSSCFKAFQVAAQTLNFTEASRQVGMTQSGVSQHVAKLEKDLGSELFLRVGKKVILTDAGISLLNFIESYNDQVLALKDLIQSSSSTLKGKVSYSMPSSCLLSPHFGMLLQEKRKAFPEIELNVSLTPSEEVIQQVLNAEIDFGFVTRKILNEELDYQYFCEEEYVMVSSLENKTPLNDLTKQKWIHYPGGEVLFDKWVAHHLGRSKTTVSYTHLRAHETDS